MDEKVNEGIELGSWLGRKQAFSAMAGRCSAADVHCMATMREEKSYKATGLTWEEFCKQQLGVSRGYADKLIHLLQEFGESYFHLAALMPITPEEYRSIAAHVNGDKVEIAGTAIRIAPHNFAALAQAVENLKQQAQPALPPPEKPAKAPRDPVNRAADQLQAAVWKLETLLAEDAAVPDRASLMTALSGSLLRLDRLDRKLREA